MGEKQSNRTFQSPARESSDAAADSPELRAQIAALAEQVRRLSAPAAPGTPAAVAPAPLEPVSAAPAPPVPLAPVEPVTTAPLEPVPLAPATPLRRSAPAAPPPPAREPLAGRTDEVAVDVIAMAERAAAEIRDNARREAARIARQRQADAADGPTTLLEVVNRQRRALAVLSAELERIEHSADILRGQVRSLEADLHRIHALLSAPGVSRGTSLHPRG